MTTTPLPASFQRDDTARVSDRVLLGLLGRYALRARGIVAIAVALLPFVALIPLAGPPLVRQAIDVHIAQGDLRGLVGVALLYLLVTILDLAGKVSNTYVASALGARISRDLRNDLSDRMLRLPFSYFRKNPMGRLMSRLTTDLDHIDDAFTSGALALVSDALQIVGILAAMLLLDAGLAAVGLSLLPALLLFTWYVRARLRDAYRKVRALHAEMNAFAAEASAGASTIQALRSEERFDRRFRRINDEYFHTNIRSNFFEASFYTGIHYFGTLTIAALLGWAGARAGISQAGLLTAMTQYVVLLFIPLRGVANRIATFQQAFSSLERVHALLAEPTERIGGAEAARTGPAALSVRGLSFAYGEGKDVLRNVSFSIGAGEKIAVVGETGSGKSTLARILLQMEDRWRGEILLDGAPVGEFSLEAARTRIGFVPQDPVLFEASLAENLSLGGEISPGRIDAVVAALDLADLSARFGSEGAGEAGRRLSEGEKQLVALGRLAAREVGLVILDEATSALDPATERRVQRALDRLLAGRSALVIAHRLSTLEGVDRILVLHRGEVAEMGTHEELRTRGGIYAKLWRLYALEGRMRALGGTPG